MMIELTRRTSWCVETPSSTSRSSSSRRRPRTRRGPTGSRGLPTVGLSCRSRRGCLAARDADLQRVAAREPELVDAVDVSRVGDRDAKPVPVVAMGIAITRCRVSRGMSSPASGDTRSCWRSMNGRSCAGERSSDTFGFALPSSRRALPSDPAPARPRAEARRSRETMSAAATRSATRSANLSNSPGTAWSAAIVAAPLPRFVDVRRGLWARSSCLVPSNGVSATHEGS